MRYSDKKETTSSKHTYRMVRSVYDIDISPSNLQITEF
jgi:hypothetical protein